ncbi:nucleoside triphosphate pyrophosphatase [Solimonas sp. SE-A11]|uniref:Maf family protein n=1 Tax=Solimonas sp. SE-A11 TaxID=3054954 RepID=UPI00259D05F4|nr:nucleoside triphosphate pyrophosphatase [Solimonas sp. SE-A11]MDM4770035.1 nucleoside triphosphate pyrophosphatase [Solimonas sp. SE-A11]
MTDFYLASRSPRRQELLRQLDLDFEVLPADIAEEPGSAEAPADYALRMAREKALAAQALAPRPLPVLGADTDVVLDGRILGKPRDRAHALELLGALADREHEVYSAVALVQGDRIETRLSVTRVRFGTVTPAAAAAYWDSGEPADKAGGYGIQGLGAQFVREIQGSYSGVVGLPLYETVELLGAFGVGATT